MTQNNNTILRHCKKDWTRCIKNKLEFYSLFFVIWPQSRKTRVANSIKAKGAIEKDKQYMKTTITFVADKIQYKLNDEEIFFFNVNISIGERLVDKFRMVQEFKIDIVG